MEIVYVYQKQRKEFGRVPQFSQSDIGTIIDDHPLEDKVDEYVVRDPSSLGVQCFPLQSYHETNTETKSVRDAGMNHIEGGWPKDVNLEDVESKKRWLKKEEAEERYGYTVSRLGKEMELRLRQNVVFDIDEDYFNNSVSYRVKKYAMEKKPKKVVEKEEKVKKTGSDSWLGGSSNKEAKRNVTEEYEEINVDFTSSEINSIVSKDESAKIVKVLKDPLESKGIMRTASGISWLPTDGSKIAVAYCDLSFSPKSGDKNFESYVWDLKNTKDPFYVMKPPSPIVCVAFSPKDSSSIIAGCQNGSVCQFDLRKGSTPVITSALTHLHKDPVYDIKWIQSKNYSQFMTTSTDGYMCLWDLNDAKAPVSPIFKTVEYYESLELEKKSLKNPVFKGVMGGKCMHYDVNMSATKFMIGTEQGAIITGTRRKKKSVFLDKVFHGHLGPVNVVERNPFLERYFLTVGDWTCKIWNEDLSTPIITTKYDSAYVTGGCWSPARPNIFFSCKSNGCLDIWDVVYNQNTPVCSLHVTSAQCHTVKCYSGSRLAVGSTDGVVSIIELSDSLAGYKNGERMSTRVDKEAVKTILERETKSEVILVNNRKEKAMEEKEQQNVVKKTINISLEKFDEEFEKIVPTSVEEEV